MVPADDAASDPQDEARQQLRHELKTPLTVIAGRAQLLARAIRRSSTLSEAERTGLLASLVAIEAAVMALVARIDAIGHQDASHAPDAPEATDES